MLSKELNERLTRVGPGTPGGELLRRYWQPIGGVAELDENPVKKVRLLGEDLVLYRDRSGNLGLIDEPCPHRRVSMEYGIPEEEGLRCPYHGWLFNHTGQCTEQPAEPWNSTFKDRVRTKAYPVQALGGLVFAYLGPEPAPLLPRFDLLVWDNVTRQIGVTLLPCNWLQAMENSLDPVHVEWLHGYYMNYVWGLKGVTNPERFSSRHKKIGFDRFDYGLIKRRVVEGNSEEDEPWRVGHPILFPNVLRVGSAGSYTFQYRVPVDDENTLHLTYTVYRPGIPVPPQESVPVYQLPLYDDQGKFLTEVVLVQDFFAWASQGAIAARDQEHLGQSDIGVIMLRELLREQIDLVAAGSDPLGTVRDASKNECIELPQEEHSYDAHVARRQAQQMEGVRLAQSWDRFSPITPYVRGLFLEAEARSSRGESLIEKERAPEVPQGQWHRQVLLLP
jgi:5,5'-dehydrodivanillate O-demethylase